MMLIRLRWCLYVSNKPLPRVQSHSNHRVLTESLYVSPLIQVNTVFLNNNVSPMEQTMLFRVYMMISYVVLCLIFFMLIILSKCSYFCFASGFGYFSDKLCSFNSTAECNIDRNVTQHFDCLFHASAF